MDNPTPWYRNRKFVAPIVTGIVTAVVGVLKMLITDFPFTEAQVFQFIMWIWAAGLGIPFADAVFDQLGRMAVIARELRAKG